MPYLLHMFLWTSLDSLHTAILLGLNICLPKCHLFNYSTKHFHFSFKVSRNLLEDYILTLICWKETLSRLFLFFLCKNTYSKPWYNKTLDISQSWVKFSWSGVTFWPVLWFDFKIWQICQLFLTSRHYNEK